MHLIHAVVLHQNFNNLVFIDCFKVIYEKIGDAQSAVFASLKRTKLPQK